MSLHFSVFQENPCQTQQPSPRNEQPCAHQQQTKSSENRIYWIIVSTSIAGIPLVNLMLFFFQPSNLVSSTDSNKKHISGLGEIQDYLLFYIAMGLYAYILATLLFVTFQFKTLKKILKQAFLLDHLFLAMLAADITYIGLHTLTFGTIYNSNEQTYALEPHIMGSIQNIVVMLLYQVTNLVATGCLRMIILSVNWRNWQIITLKILIGASSLLYFILGLIYLFGKSPMDKAIEQVVNKNQLEIIELFGNQSSSKFSDIPYYLNQNSSLKEHATIVDNFTIVYLIANFTFFFELIHKITQFDGTNELKTYYRFVRDQQEHR